MNNLKNEWDDVAEKIDCDAMRKYRYGMALRHTSQIWNVNGWNYPVDPTGLPDTFYWRVMA